MSTETRQTFGFDGYLENLTLRIDVTKAGTWTVHLEGHVRKRLPNDKLHMLNVDEHRRVAPLATPRAWMRAFEMALRGNQEAAEELANWMVEDVLVTEWLGLTAPDAETKHGVLTEAAEQNIIPWEGRIVSTEDPLASALAGVEGEKGGAPEEPDSGSAAPPGH